jgi:hypothetical protein
MKTSGLFASLTVAPSCKTSSMRLTGTAVPNLKSTFLL